MRRHAIVLLTLTGIILGIVPALGVRAAAASTAATLNAVTVPDPSTGRELLLRMQGECPFTTVQASDETLFIDLTGAKLGAIPKAAQWSHGLLAGYRLLEYTGATGQSMVRVVVETRHHEASTVQRGLAGLRVLFGQDSPAGAAPVSRKESSSVQVVNAALALPAAATQEKVAISDISIRPGPAGETFVDVATSGSAQFRVFALKDPQRVVVDFEGARNAAPRKSYGAQSSVLKEVRVGQFQEKNPAVARVVADLAGNPVFDVHAYRTGVRIELKPRPPSGSPSVLSQPPPAPVLVAKALAENSVPAPAAGSVQAAPVLPAVRAASDPPARPQPPTAVPASVAGSPLSPQAEVKDPLKADYQEALPTAGSPRQVAAALLPAPATPTPEAPLAEKAAKTLGAHMAVDSADPQGGVAGSVPPTGTQAVKYTGEPISVNLKDVDLKDFFRIIYEVSGLNIIVDPNVSGSVTLVLDAVPWDQALDIVLKNNGLGKTLEGNVLRIARLDTLTAEQEAVSKLATARQEAAPLVTVFRPVNYAKASVIATILKSWVGGGALTKRGTIIVDERTNTLIISDIQSQIPVIEYIVSKLDKRAKQVAIEARIVLATATFTRDLESALSGGFLNRSGSTLGGGSTGTGASVTPPIPTTLPNDKPLVIGQTTAAGFGAFAITNSSARYFINAAIAAAETRSEAKTISRPTIVTQNNVPGTVQQGVQIPIQTSINNTISIVYQNATLVLTVTPQVTDDGNVFMIINVNNASVGAVLTTAGPSINTQQATTQVLVPDGGTVVFGGVTVTGRTKSATYVPLLGSIPILGHLFKSSNVQDTDQELLFFVSPRVLTG
jgi:type IV pilus assembly protein PilQ